MKTPTPYHVYQTHWTVGQQIQLKPNSFNVGTTIDKKDRVVCVCNDINHPDQNKDNADWIAMACNLHDEFGALCEQFVAAVERGEGPPSETYGQMKVAFAKEKGE